MNWQLLWFVLAGLVLGFALSTLWEWLYFRRERMIVRDERIAELENQLNVYEQRDREQAAASSHWPAPVYQRPGVLLESEQIEEPADLAVEDGLSEFSESVLAGDDGTEDLEVADLESGESETEQFEGPTAEADEDKPSEPDTVRQAALIGAAVVAGPAIAAALDDDETEDSEPADPP